MKQLNKTTLETRDKLVERLESAQTDLSNALDNFNEKVRLLYDEMIANPVTEYNQVIADINGFLEDLHEEAQSYYEDRSERWQESEAGEQYQEFVEQFDASYDEADLCEPPDLDAPIDLEEIKDKLVNLATSPSEL